MYLTDQQIRVRLDEFRFIAEEPASPFDPEVQIGPCSVDLRLSASYWTPKTRSLGLLGRRRVVDLERSRTMELSPHRGWNPHRIKQNDKITIRPHQMILARTDERFQLPSDCAGAVEGRSSYARLGLSVHTGGGFINPGWKGNMPLTLYNHSPVTLKIPVGTPVCQLMIISLTQAVGADYAARGDRKYLNDQGGPSLWWRDDIMRRIRDRFANVNLDTAAFEQLDELIRDEPDEGVLARLENHLARTGDRSYGNADELLREFARSEGSRRVGAIAALGVARAAILLAVGWLLSMIITKDIETGWVIAAAVTVAVSVPLAVWGYTRKTPFYLTKDVLSLAIGRRDAKVRYLGGTESHP